MYILLMFPYMFSAFTISSVLAIRRTSLLRSSPLRFLVALTSPHRTKRVCCYSELVSCWYCKLLCSLMKQPVHTFMARSRVPKNCIKTELCFHRHVLFACVLMTFIWNIYICREKERNIEYVDKYTYNIYLFILYLSIYT